MTPLRQFVPIICAFCFASSAIAQTTIPVDSNAAYLHVDTADVANPSTPISLAALGLAPGQTLLIESVGDWNNGPGGDVFATMLAVFSGSSTLLPSALLHRVPDAIDAGVDVATPYSWPNGEPMEIDEDFAFDNFGVSIVIPPGATHLFVSTRDNYYRDNSDPDGDCGVRITLTPTTSVLPTTVKRYALSAFPSPFDTEASIEFELAGAAEIRLTIHDVEGRLVRTLVAGELSSGPHEVPWDGRNSSGRRVAAGSYFAVLNDGTHIESIRLSLLR